MAREGQINHVQVISGSHSAPGASWLQATLRCYTRLFRVHSLLLHSKASHQHIRHVCKRLPVCIDMLVRTTLLVQNLLCMAI